MATSIRNILSIYGPPDEVDRFVGRFVRGGMEAFVPLPAAANPANKYSETWGACPEYGDFEVLTATSIITGQLADGDRPHITSIKPSWLNYNDFTLADHYHEIAALNLPGFLGPDKAPLAIIVFYTKWKFPSIWIQTVINAGYEHGLVLHMQSYDVSANATVYEPAVGGSCDHFHAYTSNGLDHIQSGHCAICIHETAEPPGAELGGYCEDLASSLTDEGLPASEAAPTRAEPDSDDTDYFSRLAGL